VCVCVCAKVQKCVALLVDRLW